MSQILTQCPFCQTTFKVSDAQMQAANGVVRCGACMEVFLAGQHRVFLRERPAPHPERELPTTRDEPEWEIADDEREADDAQDIVDRDDRDDREDREGDGDGADQDDADSYTSYTSWEEAESRRLDDTSSFPEPDDDAYDTNHGPDDDVDGSIRDVAGEDVDEEPVDAPPDDADEEPAAQEPPPERPAYSGLLNPSGYSITQFSVDSFLSGFFGNTDEDDGKDDRAQSTEDAEAAAAEDNIPEGEQFPRQGAANPAVARTAVIVPDRGNRIPTLEPDVVAREEIPAEGIRAHTMNWFQSLRRSLRESRHPREETPQTDEKAEIRRRLMALRDEDSLDPVDSEHLEALYADPVELHGVRGSWQRLKGPGMTVAAIFLVLVMAGQYFWFNLDRLVLDRRMPAVTGLLCRVRTCPDASAIDLSALVTEELVVRSHPAREQALKVDFIFRNDKNREQRFPLVELNFTNNAGDVVANRVFSAREYLPGEMQLFTHMPAHSSIQASLELVDPGDEATGYSLEFRNP